MPEYPLPPEVTRDGRVSLGTVQHPALSYYQFVPRDLENEQKAGYIRDFAKRYAGTGPWRDACTVHAARLAASVAAFEAQGLPVKFAERTTAGRLLVGMGYKNALETGLTFHHPGGFPYLPGTSVKGLTRAWAEQVVGLGGSPEGRATLKRIFGSETKRVEDTSEKMVAGSVVFLDAVPVRFPILDADLLNPHAGDYYMDESGQTPPADWLSPVPVPFLAVGAGSVFRFAVVGRRTLTTPEDEPESARMPERQAAQDAQTVNDVKQAWDWLMAALTDLGAGGKTAAGYGYFVPEKEATPPIPALASSDSGRPAPPSSGGTPQTPRVTKESAFATPPVELRPGLKQIPAEVVEVRDRKCWVRLHATGFSEPIKMEGRYNADGLPPGTKVLVEVWKEEWDKKAGRPRQVRFQRNFGM